MIGITITIAIGFWHCPQCTSTFLRQNLITYQLWGVSELSTDIQSGSQMMMMQRADGVTWTKPNRQYNNIIISTYSVLCLQCNSEEEWVSILWGELFPFFFYRSKDERKKSSVICSELQSFSIADLEGNQRAISQHLLSQPEQSTDNEKINKEKKNPDQLNHINPELWWWICKIWRRTLGRFHYAESKFFLRDMILPGKYRGVYRGWVRISPPRQSPAEVGRAFLLPTSAVTRTQHYQQQFTALAKQSISVLKRQGSVSFSWAVLLRITKLSVL